VAYFDGCGTSARHDNVTSTTVTRQRMKTKIYVWQQMYTCT